MSVCGELATGREREEKERKVIDMFCAVMV